MSFAPITNINDTDSDFYPVLPPHLATFYNEGIEFKPEYYYTGCSGQRSPIPSPEGIVYNFNTFWTTGKRCWLQIKPDTTVTTVRELFPEYPGLNAIDSYGESLPETTNLAEQLRTFGDFKLHHPNAQLPEDVKRLPRPIIKEIRDLGFYETEKCYMTKDLLLFLDSKGINPRDFFVKYVK